MAGTHKLLSIIIPVFNEEKYIQEVISRVIGADTLSLKKEIIIVDDGSTDSSKLKVKSFGSAQDKSLKLKLTQNKNLVIKTIFKNKNEGKGAALKSGFLQSSGDIVLVQDADLEYNPQDYSLLLEPFLKNNADVVYGSRFISNRPHRVLYFWHYVANVLLTTFSNMLTNLNLSDIETGYKAFKGDLIRNLAKNLQSKRFGFEPEITAKIAKVKGLKIYEVGISYSGRTYEEGKKITWIDGLRAFFEIIKYNLFTH